MTDPTHIDYIQKLEAEIARLHAEKTELLEKRNAEEMQQRINYWGRRAEKAEDEVARLHAKVERLTAALKEIASWVVPDGRTAQDTARAALADDGKA